MKFKDFKILIKEHKSTNIMLDKLYWIGFDFLENETYPLWHKVDNLFELAIRSHYTDEGWEWVAWFIYENDYGKKGLAATDGKIGICHDIKSLHQYIKQHKK